MKAPDKLFLHPNHKGEVGANWLTFSLTNEDEAYIRKDALIEWAKENMDSLGRLSYGEFIDKLNSM